MSKARSKLTTIPSLKDSIERVKKSERLLDSYRVCLGELFDGWNFDDETERRIDDALKGLFNARLTLEGKRLSETAPNRDPGRAQPARPRLKRWPVLRAAIVGGDVDNSVLRTTARLDKDAGRAADILQEGDDDDLRPRKRRDRAFDFWNRGGEASDLLHNVTVDLSHFGADEWLPKLSETRLASEVERLIDSFRLDSRSFRDAHTVEREVVPKIVHTLTEQRFGMETALECARVAVECCVRRGLGKP